MADTLNTPSRGRTILKWCVRITIVCVVIVVSIAAVTYSRWRAEPSYWTEAQEFLASPQNTEQLQAMAMSVEQRVLGAAGERPLSTTASASLETTSTDSLLRAATSGGAEGADDAARFGVNPDGTQRLVLGLKEVNAWLSVKLPQWLAHQDVELPQGIGAPIVAVEDGRIVLAFNVDQIKQVISVVFEPKMTDDGRKLSLRLHEVRGGKLALPVGFLVEKLKDGQFGGGANDEALQFVSDVTRGIEVDPVQVIDGRSYRLRSFKLKPDFVELSYEVEKRRGTIRSR